MRNSPLSRAGFIVDVVVAGLFALLCVPAAFAAGQSPAALLPSLLVSAALAVRRFAPPWALALAWAGALTQMFYRLDIGIYDLAILGVLYATAAYGSRLVMNLGMASAIVGAVIAWAYLAFLRALLDGEMSGSLIHDAAEGAAVLFGLFAVLALSWVTGRLVRSLRTGRETRAREELAQRDRALAEYRVVVEQERGRIARDMHDVVAHSLAVVIAQADGARFAAAQQPEVAVGALETISSVARGALADVRVLLAELRHDEGDTPQPGFAELPALYAQLRDAGLQLEVAEHGEPVALGTGHELAAYRITQEALTNALRHGDAGRPVTLAMQWAVGGLGLEITNGVPMDAASAHAPSSHASSWHAPTGMHRATPGHGIPGMRERAQLAGGSLRAEPLGDDRFRVSAFIPRAAA